MDGAPKFRVSWLDRFLVSIAPGLAFSRMQNRAAAITLARNYEAANGGRRTQNWPRRLTDANAAAGIALPTLRAHSRDLVRNNPWARNGIRVVTRNVVGWGIAPKPLGPASTALQDAWRQWAGTTECDAAGRLTFSGLQKLVMRGVAEAGEMIIRRRWRRTSDGLSIPMQLQVLEPDYIDIFRHNFVGEQGGMVYYGIEFDAIGRRVAYWLFDNHPGAAVNVAPVSKRVPVSEVIHVYDVERAGQDRGVPWLSSAIATLKDLDEWEDAQLMQQKIAACFAAFKTDVNGDSMAVGATDPTQPGVETLEPGMIQKLAPGEDIKFATPPMPVDGGFTSRTLRRIAAGLGVTYEDLTGDFSNVNFSSARMSRLAHWGNVHDWQWNMLIPQFCDQAWAWAMEAASLVNLVPADKLPKAEWTPQPMPMTEPDREAKANNIRIRSGQASLSQVIRENGGDPDTQFDEIAKDMERLDKLKIVLDSDPRHTTQTGQKQPPDAPAAPRAADGNAPPPPPPAKAGNAQEK